MNFHDADIAKSLLITISNDIGQIASLNAQLHSLKRIYFGGYFIRGHQITMHTITYAINYWSKVLRMVLYVDPKTCTFYLLQVIEDFMNTIILLGQLYLEVIPDIQCKNCCIICVIFSYSTRTFMCYKMQIEPVVFQGTIQPLFLRHEGYLGAIGAFLKGAEEEGIVFPS